MNKVYIASSLRNFELNRKVYEKLLEKNINTFLPETIENGIHHYKPTLLKVSDICYKEIEECTVVVALCPFGKSVSAELGYAIFQKRHDEMKKIISLNMDYDDEAMIYPYIDQVFSDVNEMVNYISEFLATIQS